MDRLAMDDFLFRFVLFLFESGFTGFLGYPGFFSSRSHRDHMLVALDKPVGMQKQKKLYAGRNPGLNGVSKKTSTR
jgi:hypothetical protein